MDLLINDVLTFLQITSVSNLIALFLGIIVSLLIYKVGK